MIGGGVTALLVSDLDRAVRFYVETLGFKLRARDGARGELGAEVDGGEGVVLALHPVASGVPGVPAPGGRGSIAVGLRVNQPIDDVVRVLENRGVTFLGATRDEGATRVAPFADPDGNALYLFEPLAPKVRTTSG